MSAIRVLDPGLSNRIAAGEVVERPASVVKELIENSIDAGAGRIRVFVEEAGMKMIRVLDDGSGMDREDAQLALRRHATSKIASERDLFRIRTLGFRGEALPSIAAVSRMVLKTRRKEDDTGTAVEVEGGQILRVSDTAMAPGTDVVVRDLFYNTPARLKYVKSLQTESAHVMDTVSKAALAHPEIAFVLETEGRRSLATPGDGKLIHAVAALYGREVAGKCLPFDEQGPELRVWGLTALPEVNRAGRSHVLFFVNGRPVKHPALTAAVLGVYAGRLPIHRYPVAFVHIHLDPGLVDPNVHPAKLEVRFSEEQDVVRTVEQALRRALESARAIPRLTLPRPNSRGSKEPEKETSALEVAPAQEKQGAANQERQIQFHWPAPGRSAGSPGHLIRERTFQALQPVTGREEGRKGESQLPPSGAAPVPPSGNGGHIAADNAGQVPRVPELRAVAQVLN
ncbi:MAG: DNA mismatch repair endonuclease MutL, partial [Alicyclobacillaceae bacterium]|nr:DNA mismatch repair endonuclease MutL [Alicyclobacillaceae bacterium]